MFDDLAGGHFPASRPGKLKDSKSASKIEETEGRYKLRVSISSQFQADNLDISK